MPLTTRITKFFGIEHPILLAPMAMVLSFGELRQFADRVRAAGVPLIAQVQTLEQTRRALDVGADIVAAQGGEAGGHGTSVRSTFTRVPEVVDVVAERSPETPVLAAGGVVDGSGSGGGSGAGCRRRAGGYQVLGCRRGACFAASTAAGSRGRRRRHLSPMTMDPSTARLSGGLASRSPIPKSLSSRHVWRFSWAWDGR